MFAPPISFHQSSSSLGQSRPTARQDLAESWGQNTDQVGTLSGVLNVSLRASGAQLGYEKRER